MLNSLNCRIYKAKNIVAADEDVALAKGTD